MQGIALSRAFYGELVRPWLTEVAPNLKHAAALIGYGSELLGFDDEMSRDHNWGPRVHLYVSRADFDARAQALVTGFSRATPESFHGEPIGWRSRPHPPANSPDALGAAEHGLEIHTIEGRLEAALGLRSLADVEVLTWLGFTQQGLLSLTAGAVFHDDTGELTALRERMAYFPDDVWLYRIACQWRRIAEEQAFVGRAGMAGDDLGSRVVAGRLVRDVMGMAFLLARRYAPYAKWFGSGFARLPMAAALTPHLAAALGAEHWQARGEALAEAYLVLAQNQQALGIAPFAPVLGPYHERPFRTINADDGVAAALAGISDIRLRALPVVGAIDQVSDLTPVLMDSGLTLRMMAQLRP
ncbi:DUF4037 domain-containing protein [Devosia sp. FKR38]|uniref:DUF4037 domain-containing protein n=1 Tax=Devosia sp. FKR38 TaxID=2562312 RepID=UPI0010C026D4|nr:DUF4037 domain-containing protein [Devosia sp. FKR38]